jgi:hypothetical protein
LGNVYFVHDYRGQHRTSSENELESGDESFSDSDDSDGYVSESFSEEEDIEESTVQQDSKNIHNDDAEVEVESKVKTEQNIEMHVPAQTDQVHTSTVITKKSFVVPVIIGAGAISLGYAVYKYVSANKKNENKKKVVKEVKKK